MIANVAHALGPVFVPVLILWVAAAYIGTDLVCRAIAGDTENQGGGAALLHRLGNTSMIFGVFGQVWAIARTLAAGGIGGGADGVSELVKILSVSMWSTLAGVSVAILAEGFIMLLLSLPKTGGQKV